MDRLRSSQVVKPLTRDLSRCSKLGRHNVTRQHEWGIQLTLPQDARNQEQTLSCPNIYYKRGGITPLSLHAWQHSSAAVHIPPISACA